jgi:dTDP-4-dehydrorhamnose reductase
MTVRIFVTGAEDGQVARSLGEAAAGSADVVVGFGAPPTMDLTRPETILPAIESFGPDVVVNAAAYTAVDRAESEPELAYAINREGAAATALAAARLGVPIIQFSTDYVFDGAKDGAYVEADRPSPLGVYGRSKLDAERAVAAANPRHLILRTSWLYAPFGSNFVRTMLRLAAERDRLTVVDDQIGCPTYAPDIADAIVAIARLWSREGWGDEHSGVTHLAGPDAVTWCGFARQIVAGAAARGGRRVEVEGITTSQYPTPARRPANSRLSSERLASVFGVRLPSLEHSLSACLDRLVGPPAVVGGRV